MEQQKETRITYSVECPECKKKIKGTAVSQVEWNLKVHLKNKHNQDIKKEAIKNASK